MRARGMLWLVAYLSILLAAVRLVGADDVAAVYPELSQSRDRIVCEGCRDGRWDIYVMNADGSGLANLTNTATPDELYPHASPDGSRICFVAEEGEGEARTRSICIMNADGTGRTKVADRGREACWSPDGTRLAYLNAEFDPFTVQDFATKGITIYDVATGTSVPHPNATLEHLYNLCWAPGGTWMLSTIHAGMGYSHAILAVEAEGTRVIQLPMGGCRPDVSPDGKHVTWVEADQKLSVADLDLTGDVPVVTNQRGIVNSPEGTKAYHPDWSPDGRWIAFSRGPEHKNLGPACEMIGVQAKDWNICVVDPRQPDKWVAITNDGWSFKEPDWLPGGGKPAR
ncbi:MAG TPA: hypothetical protein PLD23_12585 [Armatimonadota bacterium]|nr:hypothetical protein [Armatimonadota bacterium]